MIQRLLIVFIVLAALGSCFAVAEGSPAEDALAATFRVCKGTCSGTGFVVAWEAAMRW